MFCLPEHRSERRPEDGAGAVTTAPMRITCSGGASSFFFGGFFLTVVFFFFFFLKRASAVVGPPRRRRPLPSPVGSEPASDVVDLVV